MFELFIKNVKLYDGSGTAPFQADIGIDGGKIKFVGKAADIGSGTNTIDGKELSMCPGFLDVHSHGDLLLGTDRGALSKLSQGVTTEITGLCGLSMFPVHPERIDETKKMLAVGAVHYPDEFGMFKDFGTYRSIVEKQPFALNTAMFMGHGALRMAVMGEENRKPEAGELEKMKELLREAMEMGVFGLSSGLIYPPGVFAQKEELIELCKIVAKYGGIYTTHMRNESAFVLNALKEAILIAEESGVKLNISHIKVMGKQNWGTSKAMLDLIHKARESGISITMDQYPYEATCTSLNVCIPPWYFGSGRKQLILGLKDPKIRKQIREEMQNPEAGYDNNYLNCGGFEAIMAVDCQKCPEAEGKTIAEYAKMIGKDPFDAYFDMLIANEGEGMAVYFCLGQEDIFRFIKDPFCMVGSDGTCSEAGQSGHPRAFGTFPKAIQWFSREQALFSMEEIIHKMTGLPAEIYGIKHKGVIAPGMDADFVLFCENTLRQTAGYVCADGLTEGIQSVWVGGQNAYTGYRLTGNRNGKLLMREGISCIRV